MPKVSICMPVYNQEKFIDSAIQSVLSQSYQNYELIIIDDCSSDSTFYKLSAYNDPRIILKRNSTNLGMVQNWNKTLRIASGQFICMIHGDDLWKGDFLSSMVSALENNLEVGLVFCAWTWIDDVQGTKIEIRPFDQDRLIDSQEAANIFLSGNVTIPAAVMTQNSIVQQLGDFNDRLIYGPDWEMWIRICLLFPVYYIANPLVAYRTHPGSVTARLRSFPGKLALEEIKVLYSISSMIYKQKQLINSLALYRKSITGIANRQYHRSFYFAYLGYIRRFIFEITISILVDPFIIRRHPIFKIVFMAIRKKQFNQMDLDILGVMRTPLGL